MTSMNDKTNIDWWGGLRFVAIWTGKIVLGLAVVCITVTAIFAMAAVSAIFKVKLTARSVD